MASVRVTIISQLSPGGMSSELFARIAEMRRKESELPANVELRPFLYIAAGDRYYLALSADEYKRQLKEPVKWREGYWFYKDKVLKVERPEVATEDAVSLLVKHKVLREEKFLEKVRRDLQAFENLEKVGSARREKIPEAVRLFVWQRDEGKCVKCSSRERLEFDHIIPVVEGGSNTERNIQLLCELCNREKGKNL